MEGKVASGLAGDLVKEKLSSVAKKLLDSLNIDKAIETSREVKGEKARGAGGSLSVPRGTSTVVSVTAKLLVCRARRRWASVLTFGRKSKVDS